MSDSTTGDAPTQEPSWDVPKLRQCLRCSHHVSEPVVRRADLFALQEPQCVAQRDAATDHFARQAQMTLPPGRHRRSDRARVN